MKKLLLTTALIVLASPAMAEEFTVKMVTDLDADQVFSFAPNALTIQPGDTVKFVNAQDDYHNVVFASVPKGAEMVESPMLEEEGASWSYTFSVAGTYGFHCHPHAGAGMMGTLIVGTPSAPGDMNEAAGHGAHAHGGEAPAVDETRKVLYWGAPMDPDFRSGKPGKSPMGMDLVPVYEEDHGESESDEGHGGGAHAH